MQFFSSRLLLGVVLMMSLTSCLDHRLGGTLSPVRLRLKTVSDGNGTKTYSYDSQNRLSTITRSDGSLSVISYGDPDRKYVYPGDRTDFTFFITYPNAADQTTGSITYYPLNLDGTSFNAGTYPLINSKGYLANYSYRYFYTFDADKHITGYSAGQPLATSTLRQESYSFTGNNITRFTSALGRDRFGPTLASYDDKINPFFGLLDPDVSVRLRFSRNNTIKLQNEANPADNVIQTYVYEYNAQNLPTKSTFTSIGFSTTTLVTTYTYESY